MAQLADKIPERTEQDENYPTKIIICFYILGTSSLTWLIGVFLKEMTSTVETGPKILAAIAVLEVGLMMLGLWATVPKGHYSLESP